MSTKSKTLQDALVNAVATGLLKSAMRLPYARRVRTVGWVVENLVAPMAGWRKRVRANLAHVRPDMDKADVNRIVNGATNNIGRTLIETYSGAEFLNRIRNLPLEGPGADALQKAHEAGQAVVLVSGHFGNINLPRAILSTKGFNLGGLYRPMSNAAVNDHYIKAMSEIGGPLFPSSRDGLAGLLRHLRGGGMAGFLIDIFSGSGAPVTFFGQTAPTALSAAEIALKYKLPMIPIYGVRRSNGLDFDIVVEAPIPHSDPVTMTQAFNDSLEAQVRQNMEQWFWIHRRWKPERQRTRAAANI